jgi:hypothetical protein
MDSGFPQDDLVRVAAEAGLIDESRARQALGEAPATVRLLVEKGVLRAQDGPALVAAYQQRVAETVRLGSPPSERCILCGGRARAERDHLVCQVCGTRVGIPKAVSVQLRPQEVEAAAADDANQVGKYVRVRKLGQGGFGEVWLAWDNPLSRYVALKLLKGQGSEDLVRFRREASLAAGLSHPNIAAVYDVGEDPPYIAMQYIHGQTADRMKLALQEAARRLAVFIKRGHKLADENKKRSYIEKYIPIIGDSLQKILNLSDGERNLTTITLVDILERSRKI